VASQSKLDSDPVILEKITKLPSADLRISEEEFFGHNCFKICNKRYYSTQDIERKIESEKKIMEKFERATKALQ